MLDSDLTTARPGFRFMGTREAWCPRVDSPAESDGLGRRRDNASSSYRLVASAAPGRILRRMDQLQSGAAWTRR